MQYNRNSTKLSRDHSFNYIIILIIWLIVIPLLSIYSFMTWNYTLPYYDGLFHKPEQIQRIALILYPWLTLFFIVSNVAFLLLFFYRKKAWGFITASFIFIFSFIFLISLLYVAHLPFYKLLYFPRHGGWIDPKIIGTEVPIVDKNIVLLKKGKAYGALIFNNQNSDNNGSLYDCTFYYREDGQGTFSKKDVNTHWKEFKLPLEYKNNLLSFGPFNIRYYPSIRGTGAIIYNYHSRVPIKEIKPDALRICITEERDISKIDATNKKWNYLASPVDWNGGR